MIYKFGAIILAAGTGDRFGASVPKQFIPMNGKPIWEYSYETLKYHPDIEQVVVVFPNGHDTFLKNDIAIGGKTRRESTLSGLKKLLEIDSEITHVIIHDAARPFLTKRIIDDCVDAMESGYDAVDVTIPPHDSIAVTDSVGELIQGIPPRKIMRIGQTPQCFNVKILLDALESVPTDIAFTDDIGIVLFNNKDVAIKNVEGDEDNMKITTQSDLIKAERISRHIMEFPYGTQAGKAVVLGAGGGIGSQIEQKLRGIGCPIVRAWNRESCDLRGDHDAVYKLEKNFYDYFVICSCLLDACDIEDYESWKDIFDVNFTHVARLLHNIRRSGCMKENASILVLGSSSAYMGRGGYTAYSSAKAALVNFVQGYAQEWPDMRLNVLNPGRCKTKSREKMFGVEPEESLISPEEVAEKALAILQMQCKGCVFDVRANGVVV